MKIKLKCSCGAEVEIECLSDVTAKVISKGWQEYHKDCKPPFIDSVLNDSFNHDGPNSQQVNFPDNLTKRDAG